MDNESIRTACAKPKGRPPTMRFMQQAATRWLLPLPNLPDGGLITGAACNPKPWVSPAAVDTMRDAKLFSIYWTAAPVCACSICLSHSLILFRSLPRRWPRHSVPLCCCVLLSDISDMWWDKRCHNSAKKKREGIMYESLLFREIERQIRFVVSRWVFSREVQLREIIGIVGGQWYWVRVPAPDEIIWNKKRQRC